MTRTLARQDGQITSYSAIVRRLSVFFPLLALLTLALIGGVAWEIREDAVRDHYSDTFMLLLVGGYVVAVSIAFARVYWRHTWHFEAAGLRVIERPRVPLTGLPRRAMVPWTDLVTLKVMGKTAKHSLRITTRGGAQFIMSQALVKNPQSRFLMADPDAMLGEVEARIRECAASAGNLLRDGLQGLAYFQTLPGLVVAGTFTLLSLPVPPLMLLAMLTGNTISPSGPNTWTAAAALLFAPLIFGWLFLKSLRERRAILQALGKSL